ncbi:MAG: transmembrane 220 family protein [Bacteroidetes Order II. Incertae sedis bacterium]|nr:transmembrane 220 family protein [Bacteroidetes Order II. bacterium]
MFSTIFPKNLHIANMVFALLFFSSAILQYNDPDPIGWTVIYLMATAVCIQSGRGALAWWVPLILVGIAALWVADIAPIFLGKTDWGRMFESWKMTDPVIEVEREVGGLIIISLWMMVLSWATFKFKSH